MVSEEVDLEVDPVSAGDVFVRHFHVDAMTKTPAADPFLFHSHGGTQETVDCQECRLQGPGSRNPSLGVPTMESDTRTSSGWVLRP